MKVETDLEIDNNQIILNILYDLGREDIYQLNDDIIKKTIKLYIEEEYTSVIPLEIPNSEVQEIKKSLINYLNNLIKQLS